MKQNGRKRAAHEGNSNQNLSDITNATQSASGPRMKRRKTNVGKDSEDIDKSRRWSSVNAIGKEILDDMGVGELTDEISNDTTQIKKSKLENEEICVPAANGGNKTEAIAETMDNSTKKTESEHREVSKLENEADISNDFFLYRRTKQPTSRGPDLFNNLSDEMVLMIFRWLPKRTLSIASRVCKRWYRVAQDEVLWTRLDLGARCIASGNMEFILNKGVNILRLAQAEICDPVFKPNSCYPERKSKLLYLDLSMASISADDLAQLLSTCHFLRKLSLEHCSLNDACCSAIAQNTSLKVLNLSACYDISRYGLSNILTGCIELSSLNLAWTNICPLSVDVLCSSIPTSMQRLNISGCKVTLNDRHVDLIVGRCPDLVELDLSDCINLTNETIKSICKLSKIEYTAFNRCYSISPSGYCLLSDVSTLMYLEVFNLFSKPGLEVLQRELPNVEINKFLFSSVARPTVGIRRTSIWGLRVRD